MPVLLSYTGIQLQKRLIEDNIVRYLVDLITKGDKSIVLACLKSLRLLAEGHLMVRQKWLDSEILVSLFQGDSINTSFINSCKSLGF